MVVRNRIYNPVENTSFNQLWIMRITQMTNASNIFIGIDVSKDSLDISLLDKHYKIKNNDSAIESFIKNHLIGLSIGLCVVESTGGYERLLIIKFNGVGIRVYRAHPNKVYSFARACGYFAKTDKLDSKLLARYAEFINKEGLPCIELNSELLELQGLRSVQIDLEEMWHAEKCRAKNLSGRALNYLKSHLKFIKNQQEALAQEIDKLISANDEMKRRRELLISYKGIGKKIATSLVIDMPELGMLDGKEAASLAGVAPKTYESGKRVARASISGGRFFVRKSLYMAALVSAYYNDKMKERYKDLLAKGKPAKVALTAIMRKIIVCVNAMIKNNKLYEI
jgi:transposase